MEALKCACCGNNDFDMDNEFYICKYCGTRYPKKVLDKISVDESPKLENYLTIARRAREDGDDDKSEEYYKKALEIDPNNWEAYFFGCEYKPKSLINLIKNHVSENERHSVIQTITEYICALSKDYCQWNGDECMEIADLIISNFDNEKESALKLYIFMYTDAYYYNDNMDVSLITENDLKIMDERMPILIKIHKIDTSYIGPRVVIANELERRRQEQERERQEKERERQEKERERQEKIAEQERKIKADAKAELKLTIIIIGITLLCCAAFYVVLKILGLL